jgi:O-antigen/teichoic acid export membrane protein
MDLDFDTALVNLLINLVLSLVLIHNIGAIGGAVAVLITYLVNLLQHIVPVADLRRWFVLARLAWKPAAAAACVAAFLAATPHQHVLLAIGAAGLVYAAVFLSLAVVSVGVRRLAAKYAIPWAE